MSEPMYFHGSRWGRPRGSYITVTEAGIDVDTTLKYLGLVLDARTKPREHFTRMGYHQTRDCLIGTAAALNVFFVSIITSLHHIIQLLYC